MRADPGGVRGRVNRDDLRASLFGGQGVLSPAQERYVVPNGFRGIQSDVAGPGVYYLTRWAYIAYIIPTTNLTVDWAEETNVTDSGTTPGEQRVQLFNPLSVISRDGFEMKVSVKVIMRVRPDQAPLMVAKIGSVQNLIDHVIHPMIDSSFRNQASSTEAMAFMQAPLPVPEPARTGCGQNCRNGRHSSPGVVGR